MEDERSANGGGVERAVTVFLAGAECPFTCSFCDLWRWTLDGPTPPGALPTQLVHALQSLAPPIPNRLKLYNASNFFDRRAKKLDLERFDRATAFLAEHDIDLRAFALLGAPYVPAEESIDWTVRTVEYAAARGAGRIAVIPVRGGNGEMERLQAVGHFVPPTLVQLETVVERCLTLAPAVVTADLWDVERLPACEACRSERVARLGQMNLSGRSQPAVSCSVCA